MKPFEFLKLEKNIGNGILKGFIISFIFVIILIIKRALFGWSVLNLNLGILWVSGLLVGVLEEIPFRGFILQKLMNRMNFSVANVLTTMLFVCLHIPIWLCTGANLIDSIKSVFLISLILGYLFKEYKSLWVSIICHSVFNICIWIGLG